MKFSIKDFLSKYDEIHSFLRIYSHLLKKSLMENFIFWAVYKIETLSLHKFSSQHSHPFHAIYLFLYYLNISKTLYSLERVSKETKSMKCVKEELWCSGEQNFRGIS